MEITVRVSARRGEFPSARNTSYYPVTTSGHFDVGRGYDFDGGDNEIQIYEPAGGAANGNVYPKVYATDTPANVRLANLDNTSQRNIVY